MIASGTLYLGKQTPQATTAADGQFGLSMLAYDRQGYKHVEPWRLVWVGQAAKDWHAAHASHLKPGTPIEVQATHLRLINGGGRCAGPELLVQVTSLRISTHNER